MTLVQISLRNVAYYCCLTSPSSYRKKYIYIDKLQALRIPAIKWKTILYPNIAGKQNPSSFIQSSALQNYIPRVLFVGWFLISCNIYYHFTEPIFHKTYSKKHWSLPALNRFFPSILSRNAYWKYSAWLFSVWKI